MQKPLEDGRFLIFGRNLVSYLGILWYPIMENQMEKNMENEMEAGIILGLY